MRTLSKVNMADSSSSESSSTSGSDYSDFEASMEGENHDRAYKPVVLSQTWRFEPPGRTEKRVQEPDENQESVRCLNQESYGW